MGIFAKKHSIGNTIAELRKEKRWTQIELAEKLQISDKTVSKWEKDAGAPSVEFFPLLAELFDVSIDYIMTGAKPEPKIVTISRAELCAKNDDVNLLDGIDCQFKDENGKTVIDYIKQYNSYKVFVSLCEKNKANISYFGILDAVEFSLLTNRLDLLCGNRSNIQGSSNGGVFWSDNNNMGLLGLLPVATADKFDFNTKKFCVLTDDFIEKLVLNSDKFNQQTMDVILGKQNGRECVWYHVFPYLIHQSYLHNKTELLNKLLDKTIANNEYAYDKLKLEGYARKNYIFNFFFIGNNYNSGGHGLVRILEDTIKLSLDRGDFDTFDKFTKINKGIINYYPSFNPYVATNYEIKMAKLKLDKTISKEEFTIQSTIHDGVVNVDELLATNDYKLIKKVLDNYPIHIIETLYKWFKNNELKALFEYAVDHNHTNLANSIIRKDGIELKLLDIARNDLCSNQYNRNSSYNKGLFKLRDKTLSNRSSLEEILDYLNEYRKQVLSDISFKLDKEKIVGDLTKDYFETQLAKGNIEIVIVKLCVRLEAIFRCDYHFEGDLSEMMDRYIRSSGEDYYGEREFVHYLHKLRKCRNSIVHSEKNIEMLSLDEIKYCIDYICNMN